MRITKIKLYKSKLDENYNNVFDGYSSIISYQSYLDRIYNDFILIDDIDRSCVFNNGVASLKLYNEAIELHDYNYCIINDKYAFFIIDIKSLNDSIDKPSSIITLKWDSYTNNYLSMQGFDNNLITRRTLHGFEKIADSNDYFVRPFTVNENVIVKKDKIDDGYMIYIAIRLREMNKSRIYNGQEFVDDIIVSVGSIPSQNVAPIFYIPYVYVINNNVEYPLNTYGGYRGIDFGVKIGSNISNYTARIETSNIFKDEMVYEAWLTTISNCEYDIVNGKAYITNGNLVEIVMSQNDDNTRTTFNAWIKDPALSNNFTYNKEQILFNPNFVSPPIINTPSKLFSTNIDEAIRYEGGIHTYPYEYKSVVFGDNEIPIIFDTSQTTAIFEYLLDRTSLNYRFLKSVDDEKTYKTYTISSRMITGVDTFGAFMNTNSAQLKNARTLANIGAQISIFTSALSAKSNPIGSGKNILNSVFGAYGNEETYKAKLIDAENMVDSLSVPPYISQDDISKLDKVFVFNNSILSEDEKLNAFYNMHYFGYEYNHIDSVSRNYKYIFDYVKTSDCKLQYIKNPNDRSELEDAYNRGITRWHIAMINLDEQSALPIFRNFDKNVVNYDNIFYVG